MADLSISKSHGVSLVLVIAGSISRARKIDQRAKKLTADFEDGAPEPVGNITAVRLEGVPTDSGTITFTIKLGGNSLVRMIAVVKGKRASLRQDTATQFEWDRSVEGYAFQNGIHWEAA